MALETTFPLLLVVMVAFGLKKAKILRKEDGRVISKLVTWLIVPATVIHSLVWMTIQPALFLLPLAAVTVVVVLLTIGFFLAPLLALRGTTRAAFLIGFPTLSLGSIGLPFMLAAFGSRGVVMLVFFDLGHAFCLFLGIPLLASVLAKGREQFHARNVLMHFLQSPILWSYLIGIVCNLAHVQSVLMSNLLTTFSQSFVLLAMVIVGLEFEIQRASFFLPLLAMYLKLAIGMGVGLLISILFGFSGVERIAVVLGASLPVSIFTIVYAKEYELDAQFLVSQLSLALPVAIGVSSLLIALSH